MRAAREAGIGVVVTDHHLPGELPPARAVVDPQRPDASGAAELCGTGVAFKLVQALVPALGLPAQPAVPSAGPGRAGYRGRYRSAPWARTEFWSGTVLGCWQTFRWPGMRALVEATGLTGKEISPGISVSFWVPGSMPPGRVGEAIDGVRLLLSDDRSGGCAGAAAGGAQ